jgi:hypothetical protein
MSFLGAQNSIALGVQGLIHIDTGVVGSADYLLAKSLRFRSSASAYLNRTASADISTYTISMWVKRGTLSTFQVLFSYSNTGSARSLNFASDDTLAFLGASFSQVYRDPAAWYHIVGSCAGGVLNWYVNGVLVGAASSSPSAIPSGAVMYLGRYSLSAIGYFDGELAEVNFVDGQALAPTLFGAYSIYNQWLPIRYAGTYGTNGFYLPFTNTTSTSTLVADSSGNANNWTPNNISLTAGSTYDSLTDVPTLTSATVANYAVLNPLKTTKAPTEGNLAVIGSNSLITDTTYGSIGVTGSGTYYFECIGPLAFGINTQDINPVVDQATGRLVYNAGAGGIYSGSTALQTGLATAGATDVVGVALNLTGSVITFYKNGVQLGTSVSITPTNTFWPFLSTTNVNTSYANFGQRPWSYNPPTGFLPLNTFNI